MISLKLDASPHSFKDNLLGLCLRGIISALIYPNVFSYKKLIYTSWFVAMLISPKSLAQSLIKNFFYPDKRRWFINKLLSVLEGGHLSETLFSQHYHQ
jgi:hypothetical protein